MHHGWRRVSSVSASYRWDVAPSGQPLRPSRQEWLTEARLGNPPAMSLSDRPSHSEAGAVRHAALAFDLLCEAALLCVARSSRSATASPLDVGQIESAVHEIRCAAYLVSARLPLARRSRAEATAWERVLTRWPSDGDDEIVALLEHAEATIDHLLDGPDPSDEEYMASLHVAFALYDLRCTSRSRR